MNLYIETDVDGNPINHPAYEDNLIEAFGEIPPHWETFVRVVKPIIGVYQKFNKPEFTYQKIDGIWTDVWSYRDMTQDEINEMQQAFKDQWSSMPDASNFTTWVFNSTLCSYDPPVEYPTDGKIYTWSGLENNWVLVSKTQ